MQPKPDIKSLIEKLKQSNIRPVSTTPFNMDRFKEIVERLKAKQNEQTKNE